MKPFVLKKPWREWNFDRVKVNRKSAILIRLGAFGDMLQASSVFPALKEQGYHLTVNCNERGYDIIKTDPHVDAFLIQRKDLVPNRELIDYWKVLKQYTDKLINLSESVERSLLAVPHDPSYNWHKGFRHLVMDVDYLTATHTIADVPDAPRRPKFYPTIQEIAWAKKYRKKLGTENKVIVWALSGSSLHKAWPHTDSIIARLMITRPDARVVMVGDNLCKILDSAWEREKRVKCKSGAWPIRKTLAFAQQCDLIIGPETGVMNAVSYEPVNKILMLSHSSSHNIGGTWQNVQILEPENTPCYPCHKLHYSWESCTRDEKTGGALCAANISPETMWQAIRNVL